LSGFWDQILGASPAAPAPALGSDHGRHLIEGLGREDRPHLMVAGLVPTNAGDRPDLREEPWAGCVDSEVLSVEPLDLSVTAGDHREILGISRDTQAQGSRELSKVIERDIRCHSICRPTLRVPH
jgi:hypothetical protein